MKIHFVSGLVTIVLFASTGCSFKFPWSRGEAGEPAPAVVRMEPPPVPAEPPAPVAPQPFQEPVPTIAPVEAEPEVPDPISAEALAKTPAPFEGEGWEAMFNGDTLTGWREVDFAGRGEVEVRSGVVRLHMGQPFTGIQYTNPFPRMNFEIAFDAMRFMGNDFFCGLTVPVGESHCSLILGGWGGGLVGISSLDGMDAAENETTKFVNFERGRWYRIRMRVTEHRLEAWVEDEKKVDVYTKDRRVSMRPGEIEMLAPMGIASWQTGGALREIRMRKVTGPADPLRAWQR